MYKRLLWLPLLMLLLCCQSVLAQAKAHTKKSGLQPTEPPATDVEKKNIQAYIELLRTNVRDEKSQIMGEVMKLDVDDAAKFWPIYSDYNAELAKVNNLRSDNILEYARAYLSLTDDKADQLIKNAFDYQRQRAELLGKYYERVKQELGGITAARFVQVENQLLLIIDLQIASSLPVVGQ